MVCMGEGLPKEAASTCCVLEGNSHGGGLHMLCLGRGTSQGDHSTSCTPTPSSLPKNTSPSLAMVTYFSTEHRLPN